MLKGAVLRYLISDALSMLGNSIAGVVLPLVLLARTGDVLAAGSLALICSVPQFAFGLLGGAVLDRVDRKLVCVVSDLVSALSIALLPIVDGVWGLSFGWFVALGLLGAVGDVPGMTARDALLPAVCRHEGVDLQRFVGASQSLGSLAAIAGPAAAALLMGALGDIDALWVTAACSCLASAASATLPREVGAVDAPRPAAGHPGEGAAGPAQTGLPALAAGARSVLTDGLRALFGTDALLRASVLLSFGITMVMGSWQGIVLPAYFSRIARPELAGYVISAMGAGMLAGSVGYTAAARLLSRRAWLVVSLAGMAAGVATMGGFPAVPVLLAGAAVVGLFAGPASALLGFFAFDRVPDGRRGSAMGTLNALYLVVAPVGTFAGSALLSSLGLKGTGIALTAAWIAVTAAALAAPALRDLGDGRGRTAGRAPEIRSAATSPVGTGAEIRSAAASPIGADGVQQGSGDSVRSEEAGR